MAFTPITWRRCLCFWEQSSQTAPLDFATTLIHLPRAGASLRLAFRPFARPKLTGARPSCRASRFVLDRPAMQRSASSRTQTPPTAAEPPSAPRRRPSGAEGSRQADPAAAAFLRRVSPRPVAQARGIRAGYSPKSAQAQGSQQLSNPKVQARIAELQRERLPEPRWMRTLSYTGCWRK